MKGKIMKMRNLSLFAVLAAMAFMVSCFDQIDTPDAGETPPPAEGMGRVEISIAGADARTLLPDYGGVTFNYKLTITKNSAVTPAVDVAFSGNSWVGELNTGDYTLMVTAYNSVTSEPVAQGSEGFTVSKGSSSSVNVGLTTLQTGTGIFSYNINVPGNVTITQGSIQFTSLSGSPNPDTILLAGGSLSGSVNLASGFYRVIFELYGTSAGHKGIYTTATIAQIVNSITTGTVYYLTEEDFNHAELCIVTFNLNYAGSSDPETQETRYGKKVIKLSPDPYRTGYAFDGWYTEAALINPYNFDTAVIGNITLYARWVYAVIFDLNYQGAPDHVIRKVEIGAKAVRPSPDPVRNASYAFGGWYTETELINSYDFNSVVSGNITLYAKWNIITNVPGVNLAAKLAWLEEYALSEVDYTVEVNASESLSPTSLSYSGRNNIGINLTGIGSVRTISLSSNGSLFTVGNGNTLTLGSNITLQGKNNNNAPLISVNGANMVMNNGSRVMGNTYQITSTGGGAGISLTGGTLKIAGGEIYNNTIFSAPANLTGSTCNGGGVLANGSTVLMTGGTIRENRITATSGGNVTGVYCFGAGIKLENNSHFEMSNGTIEGNAVAATVAKGYVYVRGGGVMIESNSSFHFTGGKIRNNTCRGINTDSTSNFAVQATGGGIDNLSEFVMDGGVVNGNACTSSSIPNRTSHGAYGGGVRTNTNFIKTGGIIYGSEATGNDADGTLLKNTAQNDGNGIGGGHAVYCDSPVLIRNATAGETDDLDGGTSGPAGGWE